MQTLLPEAFSASPQQRPCSCSDNLKSAETALCHFPTVFVSRMKLSDVSSREEKVLSLAVIFILEILKPQPKLIFIYFMASLLGNVLLYT